ncbi:alpha/beta hydrolase [Flavihumibacter sp. R14]|nr:alpha/beta hydrolase [Flavihumibacter soli]
MNEEIQIPVGDVTVTGHLTIPPNAKAIIIFSHGSGSSRHSSRNRTVAEKLQQNRFATLLFDLLTFQEDQDLKKRFDISLLTERLVKVTEWLFDEDRTKGLDVGYFGASTGAAATLEAAAHLGATIKAIVSRGGRPDLAAHILPLVKAPTLLIVGSLDYEVIHLNELAFNLLRAEKEISIVQDATHLFEEPGKLEEVSEIALAWFNTHLQGIN